MGSSTSDLDIVKLEDCEEECDCTKREAKFAFRSSDSLPGNSPTSAQHWTLVIHFPRGKKTYLFQAKEENGLLQASRAEIPFKDIQVFEKATYFGTVETSPNELLTKAKKVKTGNYNVLFNNWQTWIKEFLRLISPKLMTWLKEKVAATGSDPSISSSSVGNENEKQKVDKSNLIQNKKNLLGAP
ncbi:uncharacterized protein LOC124315838 isoform X2 [Daphnia pulicaria]|uniref:uncharacterized protein LOC124315838 isoform X2 n=1 Tax=Daphnia pulicaria TaxID=35523 RepID=UPI001EEACAD0|nr:uncharacterized protein LOC124315838 isoform X2 [Daphnia pulicaria]